MRVRECHSLAMLNQKKQPPFLVLLMGGTTAQQALEDHKVLFGAYGEIRSQEINGPLLRNSVDHEKGFTFNFLGHWKPVEGDQCLPG